MLGLCKDSYEGALYVFFGTRYYYYYYYYYYYCCCVYSSPVSIGTM